jgi:thiamine-phosphate pyrophosphorylase
VPSDRPCRSTAPPRPPRVLAISDRRALPGEGWETWCATLAASGVDALQVREKDLDDRALLELARVARRAFPAPGRLLINARADLARAAGADGVHLPVSGLPAAPVRRALGAGPRLVGRSTHTLAEVERARDEGADYVLFGPVHETPSKAGRISPRGISSLAEACRLGLPVLALGGIDEPARAAEAIAAGAHGIGGIRGFLDAARTRAMVAAIAQALEKR